MKKILFIEDEQPLQKTLGDALKNGGYKIINAFDGEIGLNLARTEKPDLILLDLILPKINGFDVLKKLKEDQEIKRIPVIVLTNLEETKDIEKALSLGASTYLIKNEYTMIEVIKKIKKFLKE